MSYNPNWTTTTQTINSSIMQGLRASSWSLCPPPCALKYVRTAIMWYVYTHVSRRTKAQDSGCTHIYWYNLLLQRETPSTPAHCMLPATFLFLESEKIHEYSTRQHLRMWQLRMSGWDLRKFKNLQLSICAELEEEIRNRNWEVQGGRQVRIWLNKLQPWKIINCPNIPQGHIRPPSQAASALQNRSKRRLVYSFFCFGQTKSLFFPPNKILSPLQTCKWKYCSTLFFFILRCG